MPAAAIVTVEPDTVQIVCEVETKLTGRPDDTVAGATGDTVALIENGAALTAWLLTGPKMIIWDASMIPKLRVTGVAAAKLPLAACDAVIVQAPAAWIVTIEPETVQIGMVVEAKLTCAMEVDVAVS